MLQGFEPNIELIQKFMSRDVRPCAAGIGHKQATNKVQTQAGSVSLAPVLLHLALNLRPHPRFFNQLQASANVTILRSKREHWILEFFRWVFDQSQLFYLNTLLLLFHQIAKDSTFYC